MNRETKYIEESVPIDPDDTDHPTLRSGTARWGTLSWRERICETMFRRQKCSVISLVGKTVGVEAIFSMLGLSDRKKIGPIWQTTTVYFDHDQRSRPLYVLRVGVTVVLYDTRGFNYF